MQTSCTCVYCKNKIRLWLPRITALKNGDNFPSIEYEFITTPYHTIDDVRYWQYDGEDFSHCKLRVYPQYYVMQIIVAVHNDSQIADNFPALEYEFITTPYKKTKNERYHQYDSDIYKDALV